MKIKKLVISILMTMLLIILETTALASIGKVNSKEVKLRKKPDASSSILDYVDKDTEVEILEQEDGWYKVKAETSIGKVTGYIKEEEIDVQEENVKNDSHKTEKVEKVENTETIPTDITPVITQQNIEENKQYSIVQDVSIKALPLINSRETAKITGNITVIEIINEWVRVENDTENGWIRKNVLKNSLTLPTSEPVQEQPEKQPEETPEVIPEEPKQEEQKEPEITKLNKTGYVSTDGLMVRKGPSTDTKAIDSLEKNDEVKIVGQTGKWYKIDLNGKEGYVSAKYISDTKLPETTSRGGSTLKDETPKQEQTPVESTPTQPETSTTGAAIVEFAKKYLGYKYVSGGASPSTGFDCSGFTTYVYKQFGVSLYRSSKDQIKNGVAVDKNNLQPGDLVIFNNEANTAIGHVGIYIGDGNFIHASNPKDGVKITTLLSGYYKIRYVGARRVI